jgi:hypothetical protein
MGVFMRIEGVFFTRLLFFALSRGQVYALRRAMKRSYRLHVLDSLLTFTCKLKFLYSRACLSCSLL